MVNNIFINSHSKRLDSLANAVSGTMISVRAAISTIGTAYAATAEIAPKSAIKQVDRLLSNPKLDIDGLLSQWAKYIIGSRSEIVIALDWTDFERDKHQTLAAYMITSHGRATPLAWKTFNKSELANHRTRYECEMVERIGRAIPPNVDITLLADRGFGSQAFYQELESLKWNYIIRFRSAIKVEHNGEVRTAKQWLPPSGRANKMISPFVTGKRTPVGAVVVVQQKRMAEPWCLATNMSQKSASSLIKLYGKRFSIEATFRDQKDLHFGMGLQSTHIRRADRRDRLLFIMAIAQAFLTLLGAASERSGLDKYLKANTSKKRQHSLLRQGAHWYHYLPETREDWLVRLISAFQEILQEQRQLTEILAAI